MTTDTTTTKAKANEAKLPANADRVATDISKAMAKVGADSMAAITTICENLVPHSAAMRKLAADWNAARQALVSTAKPASASAIHTALTAGGKLNGVTASDVAFLLALPADEADRKKLRTAYQTRCSAAKPRRIVSWQGFVGFVNEGASFAKANGTARYNPDGSDSAKYLANRKAAEATAEARAITKVRPRRNYVRDEQRAHADDAYELALAIARHYNDVGAELTLALAELSKDDQAKVRTKVRAEVKAMLELSGSDEADEATDEDTDEADAQAAA